MLTGLENEWDCVSFDTKKPWFLLPDLEKKSAPPERTGKVKQRQSLHEWRVEQIYFPMVPNRIKAALLFEKRRNQEL